MAYDKPLAYYSLGMASGFLIIVGSLFSVLWWSYPYGFGYPWMGRMMFGWGYGLSYSMALSGIYFGIAAIGVLSGIAVVIGSIMLYRRPSQASTWGAVLVVSSVVSFVAMGGFFIGALLGFVTGLLAIFLNPRTTIEQTSKI